MIAGLSDGTLSIRTRVPSKKSDLISQSTAYDSLLAGAGSGGIAHDGKAAQEGLKSFEGEQKLGREKRKKLMEWDKMLKDFRYGDAMDSVLRRVSKFSLSLLRWEYL